MIVFKVSNRNPGMLSVKFDGEDGTPEMLANLVLVLNGSYSLLSCLDLNDLIEETFDEIEGETDDVDGQAPAGDKAP